MEERILDLFWESLSHTSSKEETVNFLNDLLTSTEKLMLAKRLSVVFLLNKGYDYKDINDILKVSDQTIWRIKNNLSIKGNGYKKVIEKILSKENWEKFWEGLDKFFQGVLPPTPGTNWKEARRKQWESRRKNLKPF